MDSKGSNLRILMFPWLGYGHISTYLNVAKKLANRGFSVSLCSTPINLNIIKKNNYPLSIQLVELHLPESPELPCIYHTTHGLPPHLHSSLRQAFNMSKSNFSKIIENLKPDLLMYDLYQQWAEEIAHSHKVHAVKLLTCTAAFLSHFFRSYRKPEVEPPFPAIYSSEIEQRRFDKMIDIAVGKGRDPEDKDFFSGGNKQIALTSTSKAIEAKYIEYLQGVKCYGKLIPVGSPIQDDQGPDLMVENDELIDWLGKKDEHSTVFVSFGSEHFLSKEDLEELAFGLVHCGVNFIWVVRFPKDGEEEVALPKGFLEKIGDRGRVVNGWAPQKKILSHPSTGGFLSHCGFNSVMESIGFGVPIIAMPIHLDQPINARLMVQLGVAVEIVRDDQGKVEGEEIAQLLKSVIGHERGDALRMRVRDLRENTHSTSGKEMDEAVEELIKLCKNKVQ